MSTQGAEFVRSGGKRIPFWQMTPDAGNQTTGPISATICSVLEPGWKPSTPGFSQAPDACATIDGALSNKAQIVDSFSRDMEMPNMDKSGWALAQCRFGERCHHRFCQEGQVSADRGEKFHGCACIGLSCLWSHQRTSRTCGWLYSLSIFLSALRLATRKHELWECLSNSLINRTHVKESDHLATLAQELWDTDQMFFPRFVAT